MNVNFLRNKVYEWAVFFKGQVYGWGWFTASLNIVLDWFSPFNSLSAY